MLTWKSCQTPDQTCQDNNLAAVESIFSFEFARELWLDHLVKLNKLLCKAIKVPSGAGFTKYVIKTAADNSADSLSAQPARAWKAIKKLVTLSKSLKHAADKSIPLLHNDDEIPVRDSAQKAN